MTTGDTGSYEARDRVVYLGLGSNMGDREANLREAANRIRSLGLRLTRSSSIYETEPVGYADQAWFLNQIIEARHQSRLSPQGLLRALLDVERQMGRERVIPNGPRIIDIDILIYAGVDPPLIVTPDLVIPHPRMHVRRFVLEPLCEIAPDLIHPSGKTCRQLLAALE